MISLVRVVSSCRQAEAGQGRPGRRARFFSELFRGGGIRLEFAVFDAGHAAATEYVQKNCVFRLFVVSRSPPP